MIQSISVIHAHIAGRLRVKIPAIMQRPRLSRRLEEELEARESITSVKANSHTGTVLVTYPRNMEVDAIVSAIADAVSDASLSRRTASTVMWWTMNQYDIFQKLSTSHSGLSQADADERRRQLGPNLPQQVEEPSRWAIVARQFNSLPIAVLCASTAFSLVTGGLVDAALVGGVIAANVLIGYATESRAEATLRNYMRLDRPSALVRRDNQVSEIRSELLVPGDIILLMPGTVLTTDARVLVSNELTVDESLLTGESMPVLKVATLVSGGAVLADRYNMLYSGTTVVAGNGSAVVIATGRNTEASHIAAVIASTERTQTPMQRQLDHLGRQLTLASLLAGGTVFILGLLHKTPLLEIMRVSAALAIAAIPEGLPTVATTILASGLYRMQRHKVLIRHLSAVETLGSVSVLCFDKTGTLTQNKMAASRLTTNGHRFSVRDGFKLGMHEVDPTDYPGVVELLRVIVLCSEVEISDGQQTSIINGSSTETALLAIALRAGINVQAERKRYPRLLLNLRSEHRRYMKSVHMLDDDQAYIAVKGNPSDVLHMCDRFMDDDGPRRLSNQHRQDILAQNDDMMAQGLRILGFAFDQRPDEQERSLVWLGLVGLADPARPGIGGVIDRFHQAGIRTVMVTGDQSGTALAIANELGLADHIRLMDDTSFTELLPDQLAAEVPNIDVFSRVSPVHKLDIVQALKQADAVVAMTGDGTNDGPALRAADIGVTMGLNGTDAAREVADVVLADDDLSTLIVAVRNGRTLYSNIRKSVRFLVGTNSSEVLLTVQAAALNAGQPLNPAQLLWLNLITDVAIAYSLGWEQSEADVMLQPPRPRDEKIISGQDFRRLLTKGGLLSTTSLLAHFYGMGRYGPGGGGIAFASLVLAQLLDGFSSRSETTRAWDLKPNRYLRRTVLGSLLIQAIAMLWPVSRAVLGVAALDWRDIGVIGLAAGVPVLATELAKPGKKPIDMATDDPLLNNSMISSAVSIRHEDERDTISR
jgi:Ca2+-transporting ATPase